MKEGQKTKKSSKKWLIAIVLVVIIGAIALAFYNGIFTMPTGLMTRTTGGQETTGNPTASANGPTVTPTGNDVINKNVVNASLPYYEAVNLEPGKYSIEVNTDDPIWIRLYNQLDFDNWQKIGALGNILAGTNPEEKDKVKNIATTFAVYVGEGGKFYLIFLGDKSTTINFKITQILKFQ